MTRTILTLSVALSLCFATDAIAGNILRVGPTQPFLTIGAAIAAAVDGDLILVDPGVYPDFDLNGKSLAIMSSGGATAPYQIQPATGAAAVGVRNLSAAQTATVSHFQVVWNNGAAPAVSISNCAGSVQIEAAGIFGAGSLLNSTARAAIEVVTCQTVWIANSVVVPNVVGTTTSTWALAPGNSGLSAVYANASSLLLDVVDLAGFTAAAPATFGGDAIRLEGACHLRIDGNFPFAARLIGGSGPTFGGSCVHLIDAQQSFDVDTCHGLRVVPGAGSTPGNAGGELAWNNDRGNFQVGVQRAIPACVFDLAGTCTAASRQVPNGGTALFTVASINGIARPAWLAASPVPQMLTLPGVFGRAAFDWNSPAAFLVASGTLPANGFTQPVPVPATPALVGLTMAVQALLGPIPSMNLFGFTSATWVTVQ